ncbi:MAG: AAA family ATPase [Anaerolineae bacterium]|nr:AAA family ATPase [Anaerolineae bacterium]
MHIYLLGSCQILWQGQPFTLPRRQLRALLYRLAAQLEPVSRSHLAFLFWPDEPDATARRYLTRLLSSLRAALPQSQMLLVSEETAALNPALITADSATLAQVGLTDETAVLTHAITHYRGPFMDGFALPGAPEYEAWQLQTAHELAAHCQTLLATLVARHTAAADYPSAIATARQYLEADNLDETMHRRLIALYTAVGDRAAALRQYEQCTLILERELGVRPLPQTRAALQPQQATAAAPALPLRPSLALPLLGRHDALAQLANAYQQMVNGRSPGSGLILITGESGIGKSRLLHEFVANSSGLVLGGSSYPGSQALPYHPLVQALRATLPRMDLWTAVPLPWLSELLPLLPDLRSLFPTLADPLAMLPEQAQTRLFAALGQIMHTFATITPVLLCLDDLHWADESTLAWLHFVAGQWAQLPLVILATTSAAEVPPVAPLRQAFARTGRLAVVPLAGLPAAAVQQFLTQLSPTFAPSLTAQTADRIHAATAGNPFFILEILRDLQESDQLAAPPADLPLPASVREAIQARLAHLSPVAQQLLEAAAILTPQLEESLLRHTAGRTQAETADALDELLAHHLLQIAPAQTSAASLTFPHGLLPTAILATLTPWRQKLLHRRAGEALAQLQPGNAAALAHHFAAAGEWQTAVTHTQRAAAQAEALYAYEVALTLLNQAFAMLPHLPQPAETRRLLLRQRLRLHHTLVQLPAWQADTLELLQSAPAANDSAAWLEALESQISLSVLQSDFAQVEAAAGQALALAEQTGDRLAEARLRQTLGWHLADALGRSREGLAQLQIACALAKEVGATAVLYQSLCHLAFAQRSEGQCAAARASAAAALALTPYRPDSPPQPVFADALRELGEANAYLGHWQAAREQLRPLRDLYQTLADPWAYGAVLYNYGLYSSNMGQHDEAIASLRELVALSEAVGLPADSDYGIWHRVGLGRVLLAAGQLDEAGALLAGLDTAKLGLGRPYLAWARTVAEYHLLRGETAAALVVLQPAVDWWRQNTSLHDADVLLLLAQARLRVGDHGGAVAAAAEANTHLAPTDIARYHLRLHWTRYQISGDAAALAAARTELARQATAFTDPDLRHAFLQNVPLHQQIHQI